MADQIYYQCQRCLGKGNVDSEDIKRLYRETYWAPGICAYCEGKGRVSSGIINNIKPDDLFLSLDLNPTERNKYINDPAGYTEKIELLKSIENKSEKEALELAILFYIKRATYQIVTENRSPEQVVNYLVSEDIPKENAEMIVANVQEKIIEIKNKDEREEEREGYGGLLLGVGLFALGLILTLVSKNLMSGSGHYIAFYGLMAAGVITFFRGMINSGKTN